ncbi:MAG: FkbM family methyltransferase [bacterium]
MNIILKLLRMILDVTVFFVFLFGLLFLTAKLTVPARPFNFLINSTGAFIKKNIKKDTFEYPGEPSTFQKIYANTKLLLKDASHQPKNGTIYSENILGLNISFTDYVMLFCLVNEIFIHKIYAFESQNKEPFIIDAGSNIGISILFFKKMYPDAKIIGFEPSKTNFELLGKNIKNNNITQVQVFKKALAYKENGEIKLYNPGSTSGTVCQSQNGKTENYEIVPITRLSNYINQDVDLLKIDIEGAEYDVFQDLFDQDKLKFINKIIMEYHAPLSKLAQLFDIFNKAGFSFEIKDSLIYAYKKE